LRRLSLSALAAAALLAATAGVALAATIRHEGSLRANERAKIRFSVVAADGVITGIERVRVRRIPYRCDDGSDGALKGALADAPVEDGEFLSRGPVEGRDIAGGKVRLEGGVRRGGEVASGTLSVRFKFEDGPECRTGERRWRSEEKRS
jgi:hypothetical protein